MIAVFDNFIQDQDLLLEIQENKADIFKDQVTLNGLLVGGIILLQN